MTNENIGILNTRMSLSYEYTYAMTVLVIEGKKQPGGDSIAVTYHFFNVLRRDIDVYKVYWKQHFLCKVFNADNKLYR